MDLEDLVRRAGLRFKLLRRTPDRHLVDDLCQTTLLKCWVYVQRNGVTPPIGYVIRVGVNEYYSWARRHRPQHLPEGYDEASPEADPFTNREQEERSALLRSALETLPESYRDVISLHLGGSSLKEIADQTGLSINALKSRFHRARKLIEVKLRGYMRD